MSDNLFHSSVFAIIASVALAELIGAHSSPDIVRASDRASQRPAAIARANVPAVSMSVIELPAVTVTGHRRAPQQIDELAAATIE